MTAPNSTLRAVRMGMLLSQDDFARRIREAGTKLGEENDANKRLVQRWESGRVVFPRAVYARALEYATRLPIASLGFSMAPGVHEDGAGGHDLVSAPHPGPRPGPAAEPHGNYSGVWLSRYEYFSSGRNQTFASQHYVVVLQHGDRLTVASLGDTTSRLTLDLTLDGPVITGTWTEQTEEGGYYRGARYHGAIQMMVEPTGRRMVGKWVGFGKTMDVNTGPWRLTFENASTGKATLAEYNRRPEQS